MSDRQFPISALGAQLSAMGAQEVLVKRLAPNDNGKNQIYLAGDVSALGKIPTGAVEYFEGTSKKTRSKGRGPIFRSSVNLHWLRGDGGTEPAPQAKLILYPQYSEVRLSGFIKGCRAAPSELFDVKKRGRAPGRVLVLAPLSDGRVIAAAFAPDSPEANALRQNDGEPYGVLHRYELTRTDGDASSEQLLISKLKHIHLKGWIDPVYLQADGSFTPCWVLIAAE